MRKNIFNKLDKKLSCGILLVVCIICTIISYCIPMEVIATLSLGKKFDEPLGPIYSSDVIEMDMPSEVSSSKICGIELEMATYQKIIQDGEFLVQLIDKKSNKILAQTTTTLSNMPDNSTKTIIFDDSIEDSNDYFLRIQGVDISDAVAIWLDNGVDYEVRYNDIVFSGILNAKILYESYDDPWTWQLIVLTLIVLLMYILTDKKDKKNENK